jgi:ABC-type sugar transport system substrate-binding protein
MKRPIMIAVTAALIAAMAIAITACGGSSDSSSDATSDTGSTQASSGGSGGEKYPASFEAEVKEAAEPPKEWKGPTTSPPFKESQLVYSIPCAKVVEGCVRIDEGIKAAAAEIGWGYKSINPESDPNRAGAAIEEAINAGANVIVDIAVDPKLVAAPIRKAREQGIVVLCASCAVPDSDVGPNKLSGQVGLEPIEQGEVMAAFLAVESAGEAKVALLDDPEFGVVNRRVEGTKKALGECPGCEIVAESQFTGAEIATTLAQKSQAFFQANPSAEYAWVPYDAAATAVVQANQQAGASGVQIIGFDGNIPNIEYVENGEQLATIGSPLEWTGWAAIDSANRLLNGEEELPDPGLPSLLITQETASGYSEGGFQGDADYQAKYLELWKTGKTDTSLKSEAP